MHAIITCKVSSIHGQVPARGADIATTLLPGVYCMGFKGYLSQTPTILQVAVDQTATSITHFGI